MNTWRFKLAVLIAVFLTVGLWTACTPPPEPQLVCAPADGSVLQHNETATLRVIGSGTFTYKWTATHGQINPPDAASVIYTPPDQPVPDIVSVEVKADNRTWTLVCTYQIAPTPTPPPTPTWTPTLTPTPTPTPTLTPTPTPTPTPVPLGFQKGVALPVWWHEHYCQSEFGLTAIQDIAQLGADAIQFVPTWYQPDLNTNEMSPLEDKTTTDECLVRAIQVAHNMGLRVMLKPHVDCLAGFRGDIAPSRPETWFASYEQMILHYAEMARENDVEIFVVGTELKSMSGGAYTQQWYALIAEVRERFFNRLTYAANWDQFDEIEFWDALDYVGVDAYFPLSELENPSRDEIMRGWQSYPGAPATRHWAEEMKALARGLDRPLLLTEIGYPSQDGAARQPWRGQQDPVPASNPELQARLYEAALRTFWDQPNFQGFYWWFWDVQPDPTYAQTGYMLKEPTLQELQRWYELMPPEMPSAPAPEPTWTPTSPATLTPTPETAAAAPTLAPPPVAAVPTLRYDWESCTEEGWVAQTWEDSQGIESVAGSNEVAKTGVCSLRLNARLQAQHPNLSKGEVLIQFAEPGNPVSFVGKTITCWVYVPDEQAQGPTNSWNGVQIFVKDASYNNEYGTWINLDARHVGQARWVQVQLAPATSTPPDGYMNPGFDPGRIIVVGVKIGTNSSAPSSYQYNGPFYVDSCTW